MVNIELKTKIKGLLPQFSSGRLADRAGTLFATIGYQSEKRIQLKPNTAPSFLAEFNQEKRFNPKNGWLDEWQTVDFLFQLTDQEVKAGLSAQGRLFTNKQVDRTIINSYLFFAIALKGENYSRTQLAGITREVNKLFPMPVMVLFQYGELLTLAIIARRLHKRDPGKDVLEKVTLIKDICFADPHRAHVEILHDLSLGELSQANPVSNFVELQRAWEKTLDTSELNKKFYREVASWYFSAVKKVEFPPGGEQNEETRNATSVIRLITRLIFVWFIKEKGLVPEDLFNLHKLTEILNYRDPRGSTYYKAILQNLFFATLNTEMGKERRFRGRNRSGGMDAHHGISTVYRYEDYFQDPQAALHLFADIPFLNGGLFECLDKREEKLLVDGFSDDPRNQPVVPDALFFGEEHTEDLSEVYGDQRRSREKVRGLIHIFNSYKFTIEENTPVEEEIALDPELLGRVFENLLAAYNPETGTSARKQTGSFYTPREIVNYMVDEALIAYLEGKVKNLLNPFPEWEGEINEKLRHLLAYNNEQHQFNEEEEQYLIAAIDSIKVLDPACGSGAFPMGVLHKLVFILNKLDPDNVHWKEIQRKKAIQQTEEAYQIGNRDERRQRLLDIDESFENNTSDYGRKLYLIENCIYGVDIQPIAMQIAKLRFFISLVVDQKVDRTRPNQGIRPLPNLETKFVAANTLIAIEEPKTGKVSATSLTDHLIQNQRVELKELRHKIFRDRTPKSKREHREKDRQIRGYIADLLKADWGPTTAAKLAGWDPYDQNASAEFFDPEWMFGVTDGFDMVIGNPPYHVLPSSHTLLGQYKESYKSSHGGKVNLYRLFFECGINLLSINRSLSYITPINYLTSADSLVLRELLIKNTFMKEIIEYSEADKVFENVTQAVCTIIIVKSSKKNKNLLYYKNGEKYIIDQAKILLDKRMLIKPTNGIVNKMNEFPDTFNTICNGYQGEINVSTDKEYFSKFKKNESYYPLLRGSNIDSYRLTEAPSEFCPTNIQNRNHYKMERIVFQEVSNSGLSKRVKGHLINNMLCGHTTNYIYPRTNNIDIKFILGLLNSKLINYYFKYYNQTNHVPIGEIKNIPVPRLSQNHQNGIANLVTKILNAKLVNRETDTSLFQAEIDRLVYELYRLTEEEIAIVEGV